MKNLKSLFIIVFASFIIVFATWMCNNLFFKEDEASGFGFLLISMIWWVPGFLILGTFVGAWQVIHLTRWINLIPFVSFAFWVVLIFVLRKVYLLIKRKFLLHRNTKFIK
jgi:hypothetical protein